MKTLVTNAELEELGESLIFKFYGNTKPPPLCIDIEGFVKNFLKASIVYVSIAEEDRDKLGFTSDGEYPLTVWENGLKKKVVYPKGTVVIDSYLLREDEQSRRRFTVSHEGAHIIMPQISLTPLEPCFKRYHDNERAYNAKELKERMTLGEAQTDTLASVFLMPRTNINRVMEKYADGSQIPLYGRCVFRKRDKIALQQMADSMRVSYTSLVIRLRSLKLLEYHDLDEYIERELVYGGNIDADRSPYI